MQGRFGRPATRKAGCDSLLCSNCGGEVQGGKRFCTKCGAPMTAVDPRNAATTLPSMRPGDENARRAAATPAVPPPAAEPALPSLSGYNTAPDSPAVPRRPDWLPPPPGAAPQPPPLQSVDEKQQSIEEQPPIIVPSQVSAPPLLDPVIPEPGFDVEFVQSVLEEEERRERLSKRFYRRPRFWFLCSSLLMAPAFVLPWLRLNSGPALDAMHLPLGMLVTGHRTGVAHLTAGALMSVLLAVNVFLSFRKNRIASYFRLTALISALLTLGALLFAMRSWNLNRTDSAGYEKYEDRQMEVLLDAYGADSVIAQQDLGYLQPSPEGFMDFMKLMVAPGALFPLLSAIALLLTTRAFASSQRFLSLQIPANILAVGIVAGIIALILAALNMFFPAQWYQFTATAYKTARLRGRQEAALKKCAGLPVAPLSCEMRLGRLFMDQKREAEALALFSGIASRYPKDAEAHKYIGMIHFSSRDYHKARHHFTKFREQSKYDADVNRMLTATLRRLGDTAHDNRDINAAVKLYDEAYALVSSNKKDLGFNLRIAELHRERGTAGDLEAAAKYMKTAADLDPKSRKIQTDAAKALEAARKYKEASAYYRRCITVQKDALDCYHGIAMIEYAVNKDRDAALAALNEGLAELDVGAAAADLKELRLKIQSGK